MAYTQLQQSMKKSIKKNSGLMPALEDEKFILFSGQCFGEWGLIYKKERTASAYCLEDCDLFALEAQAFETSFNVLNN
jgi:CRP-like cAMP-binding protein